MAEEDAATRPPLAITGLTAITSSAAIGLTWTRLSDVQQYDLHWSNEADMAAARTGTISNIAPGFVHTGLKNGMTYYYQVKGSASDGTPALSEIISIEPRGNFALYRLGTGKIDSIIDDSQQDIPIESRIHVVLMSEGYLDTDLQAGVFDDDVDAWYENLFVISPYSVFEQAFVVWKASRASGQRIGVGNPQPSDTAFSVPTTESGRGISSNFPLTGPTAERVWAEIESFPYRPTVFYPAGGRTSKIAKNLVVHIMVLNPNTGRSGLSGRARRIQNPDNSDEVLSIAVAHNRPHEFSHAFARLIDEYLDHEILNLGVDNPKAEESAYAMNVMKEPKCDDLPWKHLLPGGEINTGVDLLIGAFGTPEIGYHSEFKCLMNGKHDNADFYGGNGELRAYRRFCNYCRELISFRLFERIHALDDAATSYTTWISNYRSAFYERYGFATPNEIPQTNSAGETWYEACVP